MIRKIGKALRKSLGIKMLSAFLGVMIAVLCVFTVLAVLREERKAKTGLREQGTMLVELLSRSTVLGVFAENPKMLREAARDIVSLRDVVAVTIYNNRFGKIHEERKGVPVPDAWHPSEGGTGEQYPAVRETFGTLELIKPVVLESAAARDESLYFGMQDSGGPRKVIGYVRIVLSKASYHQEVLSAIRQNVLITVVFIFLSATLMYLAIRKVIAPLGNLTEKVKALGMGLPVEPVLVETRDEVGNLAASFNEMVRARSEAERSLRESEERYRRLVDLSPDAIYVQHDGGIVFVNPSALRLLGARDLAGVTVRQAADFIDDSCRPMLETALVQVQEHRGTVAPLRVRYKQLNGQTVEAEIAITPFPFHGSTAALVIARDLTERQGMEEQIRLYQKQLFSVASEMSSLESRVEERERHLIASDLHDYVGQNLAVMTFMVGRLRQSSATPDARRILGTIEETLEQTIQYTRSLTIELNPPILAELGLKPALDALAESFQKTHGIPIRVEDDGRSGQIHGEARYLLFRCVRELMLNAVKHSQATEVRIAISSAGPLIRIVVQDNGVGISAGEQKPKGKGFGLFSVQERLKRLGGTCTIEQSPGGGASIVLTTPAEPKATRP